MKFASSLALALSALCAVTAAQHTALGHPVSAENGVAQTALGNPVTASNSGVEHSALGHPFDASASSEDAFPTGLGIPCSSNREDTPLGYSPSCDQSNDGSAVGDDHQKKNEPKHHPRDDGRYHHGPAGGSISGTDDKSLGLSSCDDSRDGSAAGSLESDDDIKVETTPAPTVPIAGTAHPDAINPYVKQNDDATKKLRSGSSSGSVSSSTAPLITAYASTADSNSSSSSSSTGFVLPLAVGGCLMAVVGAAVMLKKKRTVEGTPCDDNVYGLNLVTPVEAIHIM